MFDIAIWFLVVGTAAVNPALAGLGLIFGYTLGGKIFALINIGELTGFPLFITEPVLLILLARAVAISFRQRRLAEWRIHPRSAWLWFYAVGALNALIGLMYSSPVPVLRDSVIVFYGVIAQITVTYVTKLRHVSAIFFAVLAALFIRLSLELVHPMFGHGSTTYGLYASFIGIGCLCTFPAWGRWKPLAVAILVFFVGVMTATDVRTVWVGFFVACIFVGALYLALGWPRRDIAIGMAAVLSSILLTLVVLRVGNPAQHEVIRREFSSMFAGTKSPNLMTRVAMWEDAIEAVVPGASGIFRMFDRKVLNPFYFGTAERPDEYRMDEIARQSTNYTSSTPSATDMIAQYADRPAVSNSALARRLENSEVMRTLFGVPFGERFIPGRISAIHQVNRYDPHNSIVAVIYRTGLVGFLLFVIITAETLLRAFRSLKRAVPAKRDRVLLAAMGCCVYHLAHSLTDVTLENPFRGGPFWLLLGVMMALTSAAERDDAQG